VVQAQVGLLPQITLECIQRRWQRGVIFGTKPKFGLFEWLVDVAVW
jgi:hypothetical protein